MSAYIFVAVGGGAVGLVLGGIITQAINWHWIFFINLPIGVVHVCPGRRSYEENVGLGIRHGVDVAGSILVTAALMVGIYAIVTATRVRLVPRPTLAFGGAALAMLVAFFVLEER